jgi:hypothetical protein
MSGRRSEPNYTKASRLSHSRKRSSDGTIHKPSTDRFPHNPKLPAIATRLRETGGRRREFVLGLFDGTVARMTKVTGRRTIKIRPELPTTVRPVERSNRLDGSRSGSPTRLGCLEVLRDLCRELLVQVAIALAGDCVIPVCQEFSTTTYLHQRLGTLLVNSIIVDFHCSGDHRK